MLEPAGGFDSLLAFYNIWATQRQMLDKFLLVRYEDLQADAARELGRVLDLVGLPDVRPDIIEAAVAYAAFGNMRLLEQQGYFGDGRLRPRDPADPESFKTRRGRVGGYADYLQAEEIAFLERRMSESLVPDFGYQPCVGAPSSGAD
jgi:hypothetical protein